ncbi:TPA: hypothetical protein I8Y91_001615 [Legionella pneumophila]|nr:hypothetical protein [Legionella pneumophila]
MKYLLVILGAWGLVRSMDATNDYSIIFILLISIGLISWAWNNIKFLNYKIEEARNNLFEKMEKTTVNEESL